MNPKAYLDRIQANRSTSPTLAFLTELQRAHLNAVPFENLNIPLGQPVEIDDPSLYEKIVQLGRGGFCYELNGLFGWLLQALGFEVAFLSGQVYDPNHKRFGAPYDHMALLVQLDRPYLVDVGFGDSYRSPLPLPAGHGEDLSGEYRIQPHAQVRQGFLLEKREAERWTPAFCFTTVNQARESYRARCRYHQTSPESSFTRRVVCTQATPYGRKTLTAHSLTITTESQKVKTDLENPAELLDQLETTFNLNLMGSLPLARQEILARLEPYVTGRPAAFESHSPRPVV